MIGANRLETRQADLSLSRLSLSGPPVMIGIVGAGLRNNEVVLLKESSRWPIAISNAQSASH